jgi:YD repeat-containing protein
MTAPFRHRLLVASAILLAATPAVRATNPGWEPCSSSGGPCEDKSSAAASSASDPPKNESLDWSVKVGLARYAKPTDFTNFGQAAFEKNGNLPTFAEMFGRYFSPSPFQQIQIHLELSQSQISAATFHPSCLFLQSEANFEKLTKPPADGFGEYIHQILTDDCFTLVDLLPDPDSGWRLRVWKRDAAALTSVDGLYVTTGFVAETPLNDVIFKRSSTGGDNTLLYIQEQTTGLSGTRIITNKIVQTLDENGKPDVVTSEIFKGDSTASGDLLSKQTLTYSERGSKVWNYTIKRVVETASVNTVGGIGALDLTAQSSEDYDDYSVEAGGGELGMKRLVSRTEAFDVSGQSPQTTTYTYYDTPTNLTVHGRLKRTVHPDGSWTHNDYIISSSSPVATTTQYSGWKDILVGAKTTAKTTVTTVDANDTVVEVFVGTQLISKTKTTLGTFGSLPITKTHRWDGEYWHVTATAYYTDDAAAPSTGRIKWIENSDGTAATYSYATVSGKLVSTVLSGAGTHSGITAGTEVVTTHNLGNIPIEQVTTDIATEIVTEHWVYDATSGFDALGRPVKRVYNADTSDYDITQYACCGLEESRSRDGSSIKYYRDGLKRVYKVETKASAGSPVVATFTVEDDLVTTRTRKVGSEDSFFLGSMTRSLDGLTQTSIAPSQKSADDEDRPATTSVTVHSATGDTVTTTYEDGSTSIKAYYLSRQPRSISGTAVADKTYDYAAHDEDGGGLTSTATASGVAVTTFTDLLGRTAKVVSPATGTTTYGYYAHDDAAGSCGNLHTVTDADGVVITYGYDSEGERVTTSRTVPLASGTATRVNTTEHDVMDNVILHSTNLNTLHRQTQKISSTDVSAITTSKSYASVDGLKSGSRTFDRDTLVVSTRPNVTTGVATTTTTHPDGTSTVQTSTHGLVTSVEHKNSAGGVIYSTT